MLENSAVCILKGCFVHYRKECTHFFFNLKYLFILLYKIVLILPYIDLNLPWVYMYSPS